MTGQWYKQTIEEVVKRLKTHSQKGLDEKEVMERLKKAGSNELVKAPGVPAWQIFINQFKDFMILVLLGAIVLSVFLGEWVDAVTIIVIVLFNGILGMVQEYRAEKSMEALKEMTAPEARVVREGLEKKIPAAALVPGDIVVLGAGDKVPADIRLINSFDLEVEESALTGESVPSKKKEGIIMDNTGPGDTYNMCYMGTVVTRGRGRGVVVSTGMGTEMGQIAGLIQDVQVEETPLQRRLRQLGTWLVSFCLLICILVVVVGIYRGIPAYQMFLAGVSLAVAAIPEGLPAIVTVALALGVQRMIKRKAIIRKLRAVETLGCATVICTDKTGTLTQNEMTVRKALIGGCQVKITGEGYEPHGEFITESNKKSSDWEIFMRIAAMCSNASLFRGNLAVGGFFRKIMKEEEVSWNIAGDPTEGALAVMAAKAGIWQGKLEKEYDKIEEFPFESEKKRMSVLVRHKNSKFYVYTKGAPDVVLDLCSHYLMDGQIMPLTPELKKKFLAVNSELGGQALRVLALAYKESSPGENESREKAESSLVFAGLAGMIDPPRPAVIHAVATCKKAGIKTIMITGDHRETAGAVAREIGILDGGKMVLTGNELDNMDDRELQGLVNDVAVFARVSPKHKLRIVRALKYNGHVVAMTGDGVNDAPAVKEADIGISMGTTGTDVTKEASAMILADDNFKTIAGAVEEGRGIYDNIRKFIRYLLSCNVGEVLVMFVAVLAGLPLPLLPLQILWMNLVTDGLPAMALGLDPVEKDIMSRPPRDPGEGVFSSGLAWRIMGTGVLFAVCTLGVFILTYSTGGYDMDVARTAAFNTLVFFQLCFVFVCRSEHKSILEVGIFKNRYLVSAVIISALLQLSVTYVPFLQPVFHTVPLGIGHWMLIAGVVILPLSLGAILQLFKVKVQKRMSYIKI